jgi:RNA polymerase sigma factor (TIGR02999 family)
MTDRVQTPALGRRHSTEELIPLVYEELRGMAAEKLARESPGQTLQATALVHEVFVRLEKGAAEGQHWDSRGHFFCAAAEAMRRILVENARRKGRQKRGGGLVRRALAETEVAEIDTSPLLLDIHEALSRLEALNSSAAAVVKLRYFAGFTGKEAAEILEISTRKADHLWAYARAWLLEALGE